MEAVSTLKRISQRKRLIQAQQSKHFQLSKLRLSKVISFKIFSCRCIHLFRKSKNACEDIFLLLSKTLQCILYQQTKATWNPKLVSKFRFNIKLKKGQGRSKQDKCVLTEQELLTLLQIIFNLHTTYMKTKLDRLFIQLLQTILTEAHSCQTTEFRLFLDEQVGFQIGFFQGKKFPIWYWVMKVIKISLSFSCKL